MDILLFWSFLIIVYYLYIIIYEAGFRISLNKEKTDDFINIILLFLIVSVIVFVFVKTIMLSSRLIDDREVAIIALGIALLTFANEREFTNKNLNNFYNKIIRSFIAVLVVSLIFFVVYVGQEKEQQTNKTREIKCSSLNNKELKISLENNADSFDILCSDSEKILINKDEKYIQVVSKKQDLSLYVILENIVIFMGIFITCVTAMIDIFSKRKF
ncbi:hypothetical protein [Bacillus nitratireducens]|uniref:Uncharacterized protein n=1 Tax=Bacillus nitratireducens TaxID=2026193 RepID=A0ABU6P667_9BACI|nr:hypothetical protein [Bacillus nitratireducens]